MAYDGPSVFLTEGKATTSSGKDLYDDLISQKLSNLLLSVNSSLNSGEYEKALMALNRLVTLNSNEQSYYILRAESLLHLCDFNSAILNLEKALSIRYTDELNKKCAFYHFLYGQILYDQKMYMLALDNFQLSIEREPDILIYHIRKLSCLWAMEEHSTCLQLVTHLITNHPDTADLLVIRANLYYFYAKYTKCFEDVNKTLELNSDNTIALTLKEKLTNSADQRHAQALRHQMQGNNKKALKNINLAIDANPTCGKYHIFRGILYRNMHKFTQAHDDYLEAIKKSGQNPESQIYSDCTKQLILNYNDFAVDCYKKRHYEEAILLLNTALDSEKSEKGLYINRGDCFLQIGNLNFARSDYEQAIEIDSNCSIAKSRLAFVLYSKGIDYFSKTKYIIASQNFTAAIKLSPTIPHFYLCRAKTKFAMNELEDSKFDALVSLLLIPGSELDPAIRSRLFPGARTSEQLLECEIANDAKKYVKTLFDASNVSQDNLIRNSSLQSTCEIKTSKISKNAHNIGKNVLLRKKSTRIEDLTNIESELSEPRDWNVLSSDLDCLSFQSNDSIMPDIKKCMDEHEFHSKIYYTRQKIDKEVEKFFFSH